MDISQLNKTFLKLSISDINVEQYLRVAENIFAQPSWIVPAEEWFEINFLNGKISEVYAREIKELSEKSRLI